MQMTCPKCHGEMRVYERSGVTIDQCTECRGIFLDRGELEKLFDAESNWNTRQAQPRPAQAPPAPGGYAPPPPPPHGGGYAAPAPGYGQPVPQAYPPAAHGPGYHGHYRGGHHGHYRKRKGFLHDLFD
jgi:Zn-finger nucleic acid-binding protein